MLWAKRSLHRTGLLIHHDPSMSRDKSARLDGRALVDGADMVRNVTRARPIQEWGSIGLYVHVRKQCCFRVRHQRAGRLNVLPALDCGGRAMPKAVREYYVENLG
jgi:hypothetical protein